MNEMTLCLKFNGGTFLNGSMSSLCWSHPDGMCWGFLKNILNHDGGVWSFGTMSITSTSLISKHLNGTSILTSPDL